MPLASAPGCRRKLYGFVRVTCVRRQRGAIYGMTPHAFRAFALLTLAACAGPAGSIAAMPRAMARFPGVSVAIAFADGSSTGIASGWSDTARKVAMQPEHLLLQGSVGKTYAAAVALQLVAEGRLRLDAPVSDYLGGEPWFTRLPNARDITVRQLMNHTSGLVRYEFDEDFTRDLTANPDRTWQSHELVAYLLDAKAPFAAGGGWEYSDTNYIVLGMILERITGRAFYDEVQQRLLAPLGLVRTAPSTTRTIPGLSQGYAGANNPFGGADAMIGPDGRFAINPQFEWTGGGFASTAEDLARWGAALYGGTVLPDSIRRVMLAGVAAPLGPAGTTYGLGVIVRPPGPFGASWGHSGFFPGYVTELAHFPDLGITAVAMINTSAQGRASPPPARVIATLLQAVTAAR
jgi:D-alanyl-D-alanine carboxypeptidase